MDFMNTIRAPLHHPEGSGRYTDPSLTAADLGDLWETPDHRTIQTGQRNQILINRKRKPHITWLLMWRTHSDHAASPRHIHAWNTGSEVTKPQDLTPSSQEIRRLGNKADSPPSPPQESHQPNSQCGLLYGYKWPSFSNKLLEWKKNNGIVQE